MNTSKILLDNAIKSQVISQHHIDSFEYFIDNGLQKIINSNSEILPVIKPAGVSEFVIKLGKISVGKPDVREIDSTVRSITPMEARIRDLTYDAPLMLSVSYLADKNIIKEKEVLIGRIPIMLKSKYCNLYGLAPEDLIKIKEDPNDPGGYFIINGTERIIITTEDLGPNNILITKESQEGLQFSAKIFADAEDIKVPHTISLSSNNLLYVTFGKIKKFPAVTLLKALGVTNSSEILKNISNGEEDIENTLGVNLAAFTEKTEKEALTAVGDTLHSIHPVETAEMNIDSLLLPFLGRDKQSRTIKAEYLMYVLRRLMESAVTKNEVDKDHYSNKRLHSEFYNLDMLFRFVFRQVVNDAKYNFERGIKKDKIPAPDYIFTADQLTSRLRSSFATGQWVGNRVGITQHLDRRSFPSTVSHLRKVESQLTSNRENYRARDLHGTHFGRFCAVETPEGPKIGLTKNLALFSRISNDGVDEKEVLEHIKKSGVKLLWT